MNHLDIPILFKDRVAITIFSKNALIPYIMKELSHRGVCQEDVATLPNVSAMKMKLAHLELVERGMHTEEELVEKNWRTIKVFMESDKERGLMVKLHHPDNKRDKRSLIDAAKNAAS